MQIPLVAARGVVLTGCLLAAVGTATRSHAQQIDAIASGDGQCFAFSASDSDSFIVTENIVSQMCEAVFISGSRFGQSISSVMVLFNATPYAGVQTLAESVDGTGGDPVRASGQAELTYLSTTRFVDGVAPPFIPGQLPLRVTAPWAMTTFGLDGSIASISLTILDSDGAVFFTDTQTLTAGNETDTYVLFGAPEPMDFFTIMIAATCFSGASDDEFANCQAIIDPLIEFDQPTFDATWGAASYPLADFWEIAQSPNLIPEPGFGILGSLGALGLATLGRRRSRHARRS